MAYCWPASSFVRARTRVRKRRRTSRDSKTTSDKTTTNSTIVAKEIHVCPSWKIGLVKAPNISLQVIQLLPDGDPFPRFGGSFDRIEHNLICEAVLKSRLNGMFVYDRVDKVGDRMDERVFVTDDVTRWPPIANVGMHPAALRDQDVAKTTAVIRVGLVVILQPVHVLEIEDERPLAAVDFNLDTVLAAECKTRGFEVGERSILEATNEHNRVIDSDLALLARLAWQRAFLDKRFHLAAHLAELADEVATEINNVRIDIAVRTRAGDLALQPPDQREVRINNPVLCVTRPIVVNPAEFARGDHLLRQDDGGNPPVVVANHVDDPGLLHRVDHLSGLLHIHAERFFAEDRLAGFGGSNGNLGVCVVRGVDVHDVDGRIIDDLAPISHKLVPSPAVAGVHHPRPVAPADDLHDGAGLEIEEFVRF